MKILVLACLALSLAASASWAAEAHGQRSGSARGSESGLSGGPKAVVAIGRDGQDPTRLCSNENPNIEYRDCVNASTRDPNAKIRLG